MRCCSKDMGAAISGYRIDILATDLSSEILEKAKTGIYTQFEVQRGLAVQLLVKYFDQIGETWQLAPELRSMVQFRPINLLNDFSALGTFDVVFCRNVLIYFDQDTKTVVLDRIARQMLRRRVPCARRSRDRHRSHRCIQATGRQAWTLRSDQRDEATGARCRQCHPPCRGKGLDPSAKRGAAKIKLPAVVRRRLDIRTNRVDYRRRAGAPLLSVRVGVAARDHGQCGPRGMVDLGRRCRSGAGR